MAGVPRLSIFVIILSLGCGAQNDYVPPPPPEVTVSYPVERPVTEYLEFSGMTQPMETIEIRARVKGFLKERHFVEGGEVKKDQLLFVIDEETFEIQLAAAETRLKEAEAALKQAKVSKTREVARAQVKLSESQVHLARQERQRVSSLHERKIATEAELEQVSATLESLAAELESAQAHWDQVVATYDTNILTCEAHVESAGIAVRNATLDLSYCRMKAPIAGRISRVNFDIGNLVGDGEASVLATIVKMAPIYAYATVSEADVLRTPALRQFSNSSAEENPIPVELGLASQVGFPISGTLNYSDPSLDSETGTLRTRGEFPNSDRSLLPGMFVRMRISVAQRDKALLVPERALGTDQSGQYVLVVGPENKVLYRSVKLGVSVDDLRVVEGDLALTDQIIVEGLLRARPGATVTPIKEVKQPAETATTTSTGRR